MKQGAVFCKIMKILTTILTCSGTQERANACLDTWIKSIQAPHDYYFYGDELQARTMTKTWNCTPDDGECRNRLPEKTYKMLKMSLDYEWDFLFKCDDDTYVSFNKLVELLSGYDFTQDLYIGRKITNPFPYGQGGAGYILTRTAVQKCLKCLKYIYGDKSKNKNAEDYSVGLALRDQKIDLINADFLSTPSPKKAKQDQAVCVDAINKSNKITTHYVNPDTMKTICSMLRS